MYVRLENQFNLPLIIMLKLYKYHLNRLMFNASREYDLPKLIDKLHNIGFRVRLSCVLTEGFIENIDEVNNLIQFTKDNKVMQLSLRRIDIPNNTLNHEFADNALKHKLADNKYSLILDYIRKSVLCDRLPHGAEVYEIYGQNVCITTGLSWDAGKDDMRQLIYFPQKGADILTTSWENVEGGRI